MKPKSFYSAFTLGAIIGILASALVACGETEPKQSQPAASVIGPHGDAEEDDQVRRIANSRIAVCIDGVQYWMFNPYNMNAVAVAPRWKPDRSSPMVCTEAS